jgi:hypothetical protein
MSIIFFFLKLDYLWKYQNLGFIIFFRKSNSNYEHDIAKYFELLNMDNIFHKKYIIFWWWFLLTFFGHKQRKFMFHFWKGKVLKKTLKSLSFLYLLFNIPKRFFQNFQEKNWKMDFKSMFFCGKFSPFGKIIFQTNNNFLI